MPRDGWRGTRDSLNTGRVFSGSILIGVNTERVSIIVRNFLSNTIVARAVVGSRDSRTAPLFHLTPKEATNQVRLKLLRLKSSGLLCGTNNSLNYTRSNSHKSSSLVCSASNSSTLVCSASLNHNSISKCSNRNSSTSSNNLNIKVTLKRKKSRKGTSNNSKGLNSVDLIPVRTCRSQEGSFFLGSQFTITLPRQML